MPSPGPIDPAALLAARRALAQAGLMPPDDAPPSEPVSPTASSATPPPGPGAAPPPTAPLLPRLGASRRGPRTISLELSPRAGGTLLLEWTEHRGQDLPSFARGPRFAASYSGKPGAWDVDAPETPEEVRALAFAACRALAAWEGEANLAVPNPPPGSRTEAQEARRHTTLGGQGDKRLGAEAWPRHVERPTAWLDAPLDAAQVADPKPNPEVGGGFGAVREAPSAPDEASAPDAPKERDEAAAPPEGGRGGDEAERIDALVRELDAALRADLGTERFPASRGWDLVHARAFTFWRRVADLKLSRGDRTLSFIVFPTDPNERVYARTHRLDVVYYSDDLPPDRHDELYERDAAMIDAFVAWLESLADLGPPTSGSP